MRTEGRIAARFRDATRSTRDFTAPIRGRRGGKFLSERSGAIHSSSRQKVRTCLTLAATTFLNPPAACVALRSTVGGPQFARGYSGLTAGFQSKV
jgi:hypothetical protein